MGPSQLDGSFKHSNKHLKKLMDKITLLFTTYPQFLIISKSVALPMIKTEHADTEGTRITKPCTDPESFVRGGSNLDNVFYCVGVCFLFFFCFFFFVFFFFGGGGGGRGCFLV